MLLSQLQQQSQTRQNARKQLSGKSAELGRSDLLLNCACRPSNKDHLTEHKRHLKQQQVHRRQSMVKQEEQSVLKHEIERTKKEIKFSHVAPKVYSSVVGTAVPSYSTTPNREMSRSSSYSRLAQSNGSLSSAGSVGTSTIRKLTAEPKFPSSNDVFIKPVNRKLKAGQLPKYLMERKAKWASEHLSKLHEQEIISMGGRPGFTLMSDEERQVILDGLEMRSKEVQKEIMKLSITLKSRRSQEKKADLDSKLAQIEEDIAKFSGSTKIWVPENTKNQDMIQDAEKELFGSHDETPKDTDSSITARIAQMKFHDQDGPIDDDEKITNWLK